VTRNEGSTAIDDVLNAVGGGGDLKALEEVYAITIDSLKKQKESGVSAVCPLLPCPWSRLLPACVPC
jgi:hypothetical protein